MKKARLLLADDHLLVLEGLKRVLEPEFEVAGMAKDGRELVSLAPELKPDIALVAIVLPQLNGIEACKLLRKISPEVKVIFVTMHSDPDYVADALRAGAAGYLSKRCSASELVNAIYQVLSGRRYVTPLVMREALRPLLDPQGPRSLSSALTIRQREVLQLVAGGRSTKEIANILQVAVKTVEFHKAGLMDRLDIHTTAELTRYAIEHEMLTA